MNWDEYCDKYLDALEKHNRKWGGSFHGIESFTSHYMLNLIDTEPNIVPKFTQTSNKDIQWFLNALMDEKRKQFALILVAQTERLPNEFLPVLVQTALLDYPENFIGVACRFFGSVRVAKALFKYTKYETDIEEEIAQQAFYWATLRVDLQSEEAVELMTLLERASTNSQYSDSLRKCAQVYYLRMEGNLKPLTFETNEMGIGI